MAVPKRLKEQGKRIATQPNAFTPKPEDQTAQQDPRLKEITSRDTFNEDDTVTIEQFGQPSKTIPMKEYQGMQAAKAGGSSGFQSQAAQEIASFDKEISEGRALGKTYSEIFNEIKQKEALSQAQATAPPVGQDVSVTDPLARQNGPLEPVGFAAGAIGGAISGAGVGAAVGSVIPGAGTVVGGAVGGVLGAIGGALAKMSFNERQNTKNAYRLFIQSRSNMAKIVNNAKYDPYGSVVAYNLEKENMRLALVHLHQENQGLKRYLSGGFEEEVTAQSWYNAQVRILEQALQRSLQDPNAPATNFNFDEVVEQ